MKKKPNEIMDEVLTYVGMNARQFSAKLGYTNPNWVYELKSDRGIGISKQRAQRIIETYPEISSSYLLTGEGTLLIADTIEGNIQQNINSSHITQTGSVEGSASMDKLIGVLAEQSQQVTKAQEQIDRLITIIENTNQQIISKL